MSIQTWISGRIGNWFNPANWTTGQVPVPGDSAVINAGTASVSAAHAGARRRGRGRVDPAGRTRHRPAGDARGGRRGVPGVLRHVRDQHCPHRDRRRTLEFAAQRHLPGQGQYELRWPDPRLRQGRRAHHRFRARQHRQCRQLHLQQRRPAGGDGGRPGERAHLRRPHHHQRRPDRGPGRLGHRRRRHLHRLGHRGAGERRADDHQGQRGGHRRRRDLAEDRLRRRHGLGHPGQCRGLLGHFRLRSDRLRQSHRSHPDPGAVGAVFQANVRQPARPSQTLRRARRPGRGAGDAGHGADLRREPGAACVRPAGPFDIGLHGRQRRPRRHAGHLHAAERHPAPAVAGRADRGDRRHRGVVREHPAECLRHVIARLHQHHAAAQPAVHQHQRRHRLLERAQHHADMAGERHPDQRGHPGDRHQHGQPGGRQPDHQSGVLPGRGDRADQRSAVRDHHLQRLVGRSGHREPSAQPGLRRHSDARCRGCLRPCLC